MMDKRRKLFLGMMIAGGILILLAGVATAVLSQPADIGNAPALSSVDQIQRVSLVEAKAALDASSAIFIDVRDSGSFDGAHIPGALNIPVNDLTNRLGELDPSTWIITYCT